MTGSLTGTVSVLRLSCAIGLAERLRMRSPRAPVLVTANVLQPAHMTIKHIECVISCVKDTIFATAILAYTAINTHVYAVKCDDLT